MRSSRPVSHIVDFRERDDRELNGTKQGARDGCVGLKQKV